MAGREAAEDLFSNADYTPMTPSSSRSNPVVLGNSNNGDPPRKKFSTTVIFQDPRAINGLSINKQMALAAEG
jgi:hypothetical protein